MKLIVPTNKEGYLADKYTKHASSKYKKFDRPIVSFPIKIEDFPKETKCFSLHLVDYDSIPICGFMWIHWGAANIPVKLADIPEDASRKGLFLEGRNSNASPLLPLPEEISQGYAGPRPPVGTHNYLLTVYALDKELDLQEGFWLNDLIERSHEHEIGRAQIEIPVKA